MHIERTHSPGREEAIRRVDTFLDNLMRQPLPGGVAVENVSRIWSGNILNFSFKAKKGILGATIPGSIHVDDNSVAMDVDLPGIVTMFVPEADIRDTISRQLDGLFPG
jgi:hypothetical protein